MAPALPAFAGGSSSTPAGAEVVNGQVNLGNVWSQMNVDVSDVSGDVSAAVTAVGNTAEILTMTDSKVTNSQVTKGAVGSKLTANVGDVHNNVALQATTVCNAADISTDPVVTQVGSKQICASSDPSAAISANVHNVMGDVSIAGAAIANQLQVDTNADSFPVNNYQENQSGIYTTVNASVANVGGNVAATATAVGNSAQIVQYNTGH
jgi:hypothetical protein